MVNTSVRAAREMEALEVLTSDLCIHILCEAAISKDKFTFSSKFWWHTKSVFYLFTNIKSLLRWKDFA